MSEKQWACGHTRCYSEQTMAAVVKERDSLRSTNRQLLAACKELRIFMGMGSLDLAAKYGPDVDPQQMGEDIAKRVDAAIAAAEGEVKP